MPTEVRKMFSGMMQFGVRVNLSYIISCDKATQGTRHTFNDITMYIFGFGNLILRHPINMFADPNSLLEIEYLSRRALLDA